MASTIETLVFFYGIIFGTCNFWIDFYKIALIEVSWYTIFDFWSYMSFLIVTILLLTINIKEGIQQRLFTVLKLIVVETYMLKTVFSLYNPDVGFNLKIIKFVSEVFIYLFFIGMREHTHVEFLEETPIKIDKIPIMYHGQMEFVEAESKRMIEEVKQYKTVERKTMS
jgi:hypothetical protein